MRFCNLAVTVAALLAFLFGGCDLPFETAKGGSGSGTETTGGSKVVGRVVYEDGKAAEGASFAIRLAGFLPDTVDGEEVRFQSDGKARTGGAFAFDSVGAGTWVLEVRDGKGLVAAQTFHRPGDGKPFDLGAITLRSPGSLEGGLGSIAGMPDRGWVRTYGLQFAIRADAEGRYKLIGLPPGDFRLAARSARSLWGYPDTSRVRVASGETTRMPIWEPQPDPSEDYRAWPLRKTMVLQSASVPLAEEVRDFPLLLRLDARHLDFARSTGKDLRFADDQGRHLAYALERWDSAASEAAVWVRLDRVPAGEDLTLYLHAGKADAPDRSDPAAVFATFSGAWHFSDPVASGGASIVRDASPAGTAATGTLQMGPTTGAIALGAGFAGSHSLRVPGHPALRPARNLTLSAWIKTTATDTFGSEILSMGDSHGLRIDTDGDLWMFLSTEATAGDGRWRLCVAENRDLRDGLWHHVAGTYDGAVMRVFVDGLERSSFPIGEAPAYAAGPDFWMGRHGDGNPLYDFHGVLDEVQVSPRLRSPSWIRLGEATQRPGSTLVEFH